MLGEGTRWKYCRVTHPVLPEPPQCCVIAENFMWGGCCENAGSFKKRNVQRSFVKDLLTVTSLGLDQQSDLDSVALQP